MLYHIGSVDNVKRGVSFGLTNLVKIICRYINVPVPLVYFAQPKAYTGYYYYYFFFLQITLQPRRRLCTFGIVEVIRYSFTLLVYGVKFNSRTEQLLLVLFINGNAFRRFNDFRTCPGGR